MVLNATMCKTIGTSCTVATYKYRQIQIQTNTNTGKYKCNFCSHRHHVQTIFTLCHIKSTGPNTNTNTDILTNIDTIIAITCRTIVTSCTVTKYKYRHKYKYKYKYKYKWPEDMNSSCPFHCVRIFGAISI